MREIEIKAKVEHHNAVIDVLTKRGTILSEPVTQHDRVWGVRGENGYSGHNTAPWLRVRSEVRAGEAKHYFTLKRSVTNQLDSIEHETEIADDRELEAIINQLDFVPFSDLTKTRQKAHIGDIELCLDYIEELGYFIEAEKLTTDDADAASISAELWSLFESLGISRSDEVTKGYDVLINEKRAA